jgi:hypothetical protein
VIVTVDPRLALVPALGDSSSTRPSSELFTTGWKVVETWKPAEVSVEVASAWVWPMTSGTVTCDWPDDT